MSVIRSSDPVERGDLVLAIEWVLTVGQQSNGDACNSCLALTMEGLCQSTKAFGKWQGDVMDCTLGRTGNNTMSTGGGGATAALNRYFHAQLSASHASHAKSTALQTAILQQMVSGGLQAAGQSKSTKGCLYNSHD